MPISNIEDYWSSRRIYLMAVLCQIIGIPTFIMLPNAAVTHGATGYIIGYIFSYLFIGIPVLYMEFVVSQFTTRDCINVWKARACLSHIGYFLIIWQCFVVIYNHIINSFMVHYLLISFENPIPYYVCGPWTTQSCNILIRNHTVNEDCLRLKQPLSYCDYLHTTYPEYQYWKHNLLGVKGMNYFHVAWRVCLASFLICVIMYLSCFKRQKSVKWIVGILILYPIFGYSLLMMGSMVQKGLVIEYEEALDSDFSLFVQKFRIPHMIYQVVYSLGLGSGIPFNLAAGSFFRAPCYSNTVTTVLISAVFTTLAVCTTAMMSCSYAYEYKISPHRIMQSQLSLVFEKTTRLLYEYENKTFWLIIIFSSNSMLGIGSNVILILHLLDIVCLRYEIVAKYPGMICFIGVSFIFFITIPLFGHVGMNIIVGFRRFVNFVPVFIASLECFVYVIWYGLDRFSEDVHFMQGIQPKSYLKIGWMTSSFILGYVFVTELYIQKNNSKETLGDTIGWYSLIASIGMIVCIFVIKLLIGVFRKNITEVIQLDPTWGPRSEVLQRSRAMFTAQAMTKEYMYRQYHLQAGISMRQRTANVRRECYQ
ncbi:sodium- and chloride-dependent glycine transporter 2-like [Achroia grisella]|uniref:sodium- and chloride-dependent glycine transporter 2-like n=1 Tax=Achroia grisella TaxID=688607 RepID=UPI0027D22D96|nr:sodium- and chloride-dependent glycine transporter 2-like [Achroia grisella]